MAADIHQTAIVDRSARIGNDCVIGPYCIVGPGVRLGRGTRVHAHVILDGRLTIGDDCEIFSFACLGKQTQDLKFQGGKGRIDVGSGTTVREYVTVHMPTSEEGVTRVGANCHLLAYCHIAHDCLLGDGVIMSNGTNLAGHVVVGDHAVFGGLVGVHQFVRIGTMVMVGGMSKVVQDLVPCALAEGIPASPRTVNKIGMQRNQLDEHEIRNVQKAHKLIFRAELTLEAAADAIRKNLPPSPRIKAILDFITTSERGIARPRMKTEATDHD